MLELGNASDRGGEREAGGQAERLRVTATACLSLQRPGRPCDLCARACPTDAITIGERSIRIEVQDCSGCGRCQAACPTEAIEVDGFALPFASELRIECCRVPKSERVSTHAVTDAIVPCLGGLGAETLRRLLAASEARVAIVDRGWCETCPISGDTAPWAAVVERLARDLVIVERDAGRLRVAHEPLPAAEAGPPPAAPGTQRGHQLSRRGLFAAFAKPKSLRPPQAVRLRQTEVVPEQVDAFALGQRLDWLRGLSGPVELPAALFPAATIADTCCTNQVCVRACPTGALQPITETGRVGVTLDAPLCIRCGACESACPTGSMSIVPGGAGLYSGPVVLREERFVTCSRCEAGFISKSDDEQVCLACRKDAEVARLGHSLFRPRTTVRDDEPVA